VLLLLLAAPGPAGAATMIRDAEIEETIARLARPILDAARLDPESIDIFVLRDDRLNAFVAGGQNLFINTGLLIRSESAEQVAGVIAHEAGHIAGGHLSRAVAARERATVESLIGAVLGAAAAVAGAPQVGTAIMAGGATVAQRGILAFSRSQEQAADQAAIGFLASAGRSPRGLLEFLRILDNQNLRISNSDSNAFLRTHPLTRERVAFLEQQVEASRFRDTPTEPGLAEAHARMVAKLDAFLAEPNAALRRYRGDGLADRYAQAVAYFRLSQVDRALALLDGLAKERPTTPGSASSRARSCSRAAASRRPRRPTARRCGSARTHP
jgi:predicted Zn-dependent protease